MKIFNQVLSKNQRTATIQKNVIGTMLLRGCSIAISLVLVPMTLGFVDSVLYGVWLTISSIMTWFHFMDVGFTLGLKNKLAEALAVADFERGKSLVSTTYAMMVAIFIPLLIIFTFINPHINWAGFLNIDSAYNGEVVKAMYVLIVCFCLHMIVGVLTAVVAAHQRVAFSTSFVVIGNALALLMIAFMTKFVEPSLMALAFSISTMPVLVLAVASLILFNGKFKTVAPSYKLVKKEHVKELFNLGYKFFLIQIQMLVLYHATNVLISNVSGPEDVTSYNLSYKLISVMMMVYTMMLQPMWPAFTDAYAKKDFKWMKNVYKKMIKIYIICVGAVIVMVLASPLVYKVWIGDRAHVPFLMTVIVAIYVLVHSWDTLQVNLINGIGTIRLQTYITTIGLISHIPLAFTLGKYIGAYGVVVSMALICAFYSVIFTIQLNKLLNEKAQGIWAA